MTERRSHQCHKDGCDSQATLLVDLHLNCCAPGITRKVSMHATIQVCEAHRDDVRGYVLSEQNKETIRTALMDSGVPEPDFLTAEIEFKPIHPDPVVVVPEVLGCDRDECANPARWRIKQGFRSIGQHGRGRVQVEALTNIYVCDKHKRATKPADLLRGTDRTRTRDYLNGRGMMLPDLDGMVLEFLPVPTGEPEAMRGKHVKPSG